jgi:hypothetical protein
VAFLPAGDGKIVSMMAGGAFDELVEDSARRSIGGGDPCRQGRGARAVVR